MRLRFTEVMEFEFEIISVAFFVRRFNHIAEIEGPEAVLCILPMCLKGAALEWHTSLSARVRREMT